MSTPEDRQHGAALVLMATYGPTLVRSVHEPEDWEWIAAHEIGQTMGLTAADVVDLSSPTVFRLFDSLVANAVLLMARTPEELDGLWQDTKSIRHRIPPSRRTEPITTFHAIEAEKLNRTWAMQRLDGAGWPWNAEERKAKRPPQKGLDTGNRPREFLTYVVLAIYDQRHVEWCARTGSSHKNPQPLREEIGHALRWFFPTTSLVSKKYEPIHNAIHNNRKKGPLRQ